MNHILDHPQSKELETISRIIDENATICRYVLQDLNKGKLVSHKAGARGMSADQVLRCAVVKVLFGFSYEELAFHIVDSQSIRWFCRIGIADEGFKKSALNKNIKAISEQTWQAINRHILGYAKKENIEKGRTVRVDCTSVESNIHDPRDSNLLWDSVRVLTRLIERCRQEGIKVAGFSNHTRVAKRRMLAILNAKNKAQRKAAYIDLLKAAGKVSTYADSALKATPCTPKAMALQAAIEHYAKLTAKVIDQTRRRVIHGEKVPARQKVVSIFEPAYRHYYQRPPEYLLRS